MSIVSVWFMSLISVNTRVATTTLKVQGVSISPEYRHPPPAALAPDGR